MLAWITGPVPDYLKLQVVAVDRRGQETALALPAQAYGQAMALSPDGRWLALSVRSLARDSLMVYNLESGTSIPLTEEGEARLARLVAGRTVCLVRVDQNGVAARSGVGR